MKPPAHHRVLLGNIHFSHLQISFLRVTVASSNVLGVCSSESFDVAMMYSTTDGSDGRMMESQEHNSQEFLNLCPHMEISGYVACSLCCLRCRMRVAGGPTDGTCNATQEIYFVSRKVFLNT